MIISEMIYTRNNLSTYPLFTYNYRLSFYLTIGYVLSLRDYFKKRKRHNKNGWDTSLHENKTSNNNEFANNRYVNE